MGIVTVLHRAGGINYQLPKMAFRTGSFYIYIIILPCIIAYQLVINHHPFMFSEDMLLPIVIQGTVDK